MIRVHSEQGPTKVTELDRHGVREGDTGGVVREDELVEKRRGEVRVSEDTYVLREDGLWNKKGTLIDKLRGWSNHHRRMRRNERPLTAVT